MTVASKLKRYAFSDWSCNTGVGTIPPLVFAHADFRLYDVRESFILNWRENRNQMFRYLRTELLWYSYLPPKPHIWWRTVTSCVLAVFYFSTSGRHSPIPIAQPMATILQFALLECNGFNYFVLFIITDIFQRKARNRVTNLIAFLGNKDNAKVVIR